MFTTPFSFMAAPVAGYDADAQAFFDRVTAAGGSLTTTEKNATNTLVLDLKADSIWSNFIAIYPMVGSSAAACAQNLKSSSFTGTFSSGWTFASTGVTPNGIDAYMDTGLAPLGNLSQNDAHVSIYSRTNDLTGTQVDLGCGSGGLNQALYLSAYYGNTGNGISNINGSGFSPIGTNINSLGLFCSQRTGANTTKMYQNNILILNQVSSSITPIADNIQLGRNSPTGEWSSRELAFSSMGSSFTLTGIGDFYTAVQAFQTTLGRQV